MKRISIFKNESLNKEAMHLVFGGRGPRGTKWTLQDGSETCDTHDDTNDNGTLDAGECITYHKCN
ncbi:hypothetical protein SAMN04489761_2586 [Tenacibaculum sp. MAR_2009_124]|uniref:hypothetical protein n=1 Tax=Tenacibaculum sp. MAR_2009_124 TaxID=1250059 RepID=UPI00089B6DD9|nr:hypothetical protein [Tenacibaculum sp. MAR_2009_124]SEC28891.1 hypothetical protein SAMN04489761_2586 [Tenacibaculum sp. MAR_2009_124]